MGVNELLQGVSYEDYAAWGGIRASDLSTMRISLAHYAAAKRAKPSEKPSEALAFGKMFHLAMENGERFLEKIAVAPKVNLSTNKGKEELATFRAGLTPDRIEIKNDWYDPLVGMIKAMSKHSRVKRLIREGVREVSLKVKDPETGLLIQCRPDFIPAEGFCVDFKTTRSASPSFFINQIFSKRYDSDPFYVLAAAHYRHCLKTAGIGKESFTIIAIEKEDPYGIVVYPLDSGCLEVGEQWRAKLMRDFSDANKKNMAARLLDPKAEDFWPGYPEKFYPLTVPKYAKEIEEDSIW